ncbi:MAG TPA: hypothetical protein VF739_11010 [Ktedonobacterales bacterium]
MSAEFNVRSNIIKTVVYAKQTEPDYAGPRPARQRPQFMSN